ncbi:hypothetical protein [Candidatus Hodgkinia cicadicola]|uniref:hypothetical protein n=1 Tax=Candidatus Hodgkinia cicadicola TaxID=573658 RepID=UPI001788D92E
MYICYLRLTKPSYLDVLTTKSNETSNKIGTSVLHLITGFKSVLIKVKSTISGFND